MDNRGYRRVYQHKTKEREGMKIYHGSLEKVDIPETRQRQRTLDYGSGFYATTSYSFPTPTEEWVDFVMKNRMQEGVCHDYD